MRAATTEKSPLAQVACCRCLIAAKSGRVFWAGGTTETAMGNLLVQGHEKTTDRALNNTTDRATMSRGKTARTKGHNRSCYHVPHEPHRRSDPHRCNGDGAAEAARRRYRQPPCHPG